MYASKSDLFPGWGNLWDNNTKEQLNLQLVKHSLNWTVSYFLTPFKSFSKITPGHVFNKPGSHLTFCGTVEIYEVCEEEELFNNPVEGWKMQMYEIPTYV